MESMLEAVRRLREAGYTLDLEAAPGGRLQCLRCGLDVDAAEVQIHETVRFEGDSNPDDEAILVAVSMPCGDLGLFSAAFGPDTPADDVAVLQALVRR